LRLAFRSDICYGDRKIFNLPAPCSDSDMNLSSVMEFLHDFKTDRVIEFLQDMQVGDLISNPWFLGSMALAALIALVMHWRLLLVTILGLTGFSGLLSYTLSRGTEIESLQSSTLLVFVGGGVFLLFIVIYLLFIKSD